MDPRGLENAAKLRDGDLPLPAGRMAYQSAVATYNTGKDSFPKPADSARLCGSQCEKGVFEQTATLTCNPRSADSFRTTLSTYIIRYFRI